MASHNDAKLREAQQQVDSTVGVMRNNLAMMLERDHKLSELDERADNLEATSVQFKTTANKVKKKMWWQNLKMNLIIGGIILAVIIIIITVIAVEAGGSGSSDEIVENRPEYNNEGAAPAPAGGAADT